MFEQGKYFQWLEFRRMHTGCRNTLMKIIQVNNFHRGRGGPDSMAELTTIILENRGHEVILLHRDNREFLGADGKKPSNITMVGFIMNAFWRFMYGQSG
jgi:hypothetical protein